MKIIPLEMTEGGWETAEEEVEFSSGFSKGVYIHFAPFRYNGKDVFIPLRVGQAKGGKGMYQFLNQNRYSKTIFIPTDGDLSHVGI